MNRLRNILLTVIILTIGPIVLDGKDSLSYRDITHRLTAEVHPVYNIPTHYFYRGNNPSCKAIGPASSFHLKYSFSLPYTYQGIGVSYNTFYQKDIVGSPAAIYIFQGVRLLSLSHNLSFGYEWNLGLSYGWKPNSVVSSRSNIYINVGLPLTWKASDSWEFQIGPEYTHFSNGDTSFPNGGANTVGLRIGASRLFGDDASSCLGKALISADEGIMNVRFKDRISYDIFIYGAWRAARTLNGSSLQIKNSPHALGGLSFNPLYRINRYFLFGPSLDLQADTSVGLNASLSAPSLWDQTSCGLSLRGEIKMPFFSVNIGAGWNAIVNCNDIKRFYTTYTLKSFVSDKFFISIGYRLSAVQYTHNLMLGAGFRL